MTTTKDRLRESSALSSSPYMFEMLNHAIDEIERLERENAELKSETQRLGGLINSALNATGKEKLSELGHDYLALKGDLAKAREDALEEAAELAYAYIVDNGLRYDHRTTLPSEIRALKEKP